MIRKNLKTGFTLTEVLVVTIILVLIVVTIFTVHTFSQRGYREGEELAELTQNGRVILERISREIRQTKEIIPLFPDTETNATSNIQFQDGHIPSVYVTSTPVEIGTNTIKLASDSSTSTDFYKDMFLEIISGEGNEENKIRKIIAYNGGNQVATLDRAWLDPKPTIASIYKIDSAYYYICYFASSTEIYREVIAYYFPSDPNTYLPWNAISASETLTKKKLGRTKNHRRIC